MQTARREARLRPEYAALYAGVPAGQWRPLAELLDCVAAAGVVEDEAAIPPLYARVLTEAGFRVAVAPDGFAGRK